jgi:hypothetical protein
VLLNKRPRKLAHCRIWNVTIPIASFQPSILQNESALRENNAHLPDPRLDAHLHEMISNAAKA